jgi:hypothetical protein
VVYWNFREQLSLANRLRRSYYELLRDQLDHWMIQSALVDSYANFSSKKQAYPFVEKRELKPRARIPDIEHKNQNSFLVIFVEDTIPSSYKKYIRFFNENKTTRTNLTEARVLSLADDFDRNQKYIEVVVFPDLLKKLIPVDYAMLIQRDPASRNRDRYHLSHFHVRIDCPIAKAAEMLAMNLRYISKDLFERGDKYAEDLQKKFFEYYGLPFMSGGRRTAAIVAAQYLKKLSCITTVYVGSAASRSLTRISERGTSKAVLIKLTNEEMAQLTESHHLSMYTFQKNYVVHKKEGYGICIFQVCYSCTDQASPPDDGKLRDLRPDLNWQTVSVQQILPKPGVWRYPPLPFNLIYS